MSKETRAEQEAEADSKTVIVLFCTEIYIYIYILWTFSLPAKSGIKRTSRRAAASKLPLSRSSIFGSEINGRTAERETEKGENEGKGGTWEGVGELVSRKDLFFQMLYLLTYRASK